MKIEEVSVEPLKAQQNQIGQEEKQLKIKRANLKIRRAQATITKAQQDKADATEPCQN